MLLGLVLQIIRYGGEERTGALQAAFNVPFLQIADKGNCIEGVFGRYALIEFKLGSREIEEGAEHLLEIKRLVQEHNKTERQIKLREPDLMMVITGGEMAYSRPDGVKVMPLACLKD